MSTQIDSPNLAAAPAREPGLRIHLGHLLRSERIKMTSTKTWWLFGIGILGATALALLVNCLSANSDHVGQLSQPGIDQRAANIYTSGQYFGGLFVVLLAILLITNEYYHQTATSTFLATPRRTSVVLSKFVMAMLAAAVVWLVTTAINLFVGYLFLRYEGVGPALGEWPVQRAILINLLMFALWGVFGIGLGALLRSQIGATVTAALLYTIGIYAAFAVFALLRTYVFHTDQVWKGVVLIPAIAAQIAESPDSVSLPGNVHVTWWWGVVVMLAYGVIMAVVGTLILRKRDIS